MNRQNFEAQDRFPLSTQSLTFMQNMVLATAQLALIGGNNYILSGCTVSGSTVSDGVIVIDGEVMPFEGGTVVETITIMEETISVSADGITFDKARTTRKAKFASGSGSNYYRWADFKPLQTNKQLEEVKATVRYVDEEIAKIQAGSIPAGVIVMWAGREADIPTGWCLCDGRTLPNDITTPDLRGRFIVGYNSTSGSGYTSIGAGSKGADQYKITLSIDEMPAHNHNMPTKSEIVTPGEYGLIRLSKSDEKVTNADVDRGGSGTEPDICASPKSVAIPTEGKGQPFDIRPPYYVLAFIIKI